MGRFLSLLLLACVLVGGALFWISRPKPIADGDLPAMTGDAERGRDVFLAAGCASCHADQGSEPVAKPLLSGGRRLTTPFGTFVAPNISQDLQHGIGGASLAELASVLQRGVGRDGRHLYPVMPYASYTRMTLPDIADLKAYLETLPADDTPDGRHDLPVQYSIRRSIGLWKERYMDPTFVGAAPSPTLERGRYLVEALGHCAECHTPRDRFGGLDRTRWMAGAPEISGRGAVPNITPAALDWSADEMAWYLESGFNPDHKEVSRDMEAVIAGISQLPREDRDAIAAYIGGLAPVQ
ncbi:mono/diheme cytochrome c family protein [Aliiruegeria haliotis]|uniref:Mono/diheme cytochrome c family protein n=1 Tax=Aliiruegeria haliotis TaxID=1280846 RepID=A0A2T0S018_9RHOB|nr:c-type cytochrome [Aliiruegeria haliotis]PRY26712.1 mono/diheme cytochrome c family protein [Aliiruegeria haliotis]